MVRSELSAARTKCRRCSKSGNCEKPCSTLSFLDQNLSHLRTGDAKGFPGIPKGSQRVPKGSQRILPKKSQKNSETLYIYVSCDVEFYRVLLDFKINLDRTGTLRFTLFWGGFSSRPSRPAGESEPGWARPGKSPKIHQTERSCSNEIDFEI